MTACQESVADELAGLLKRLHQGHARRGHREFIEHAGHQDWIFHEFELGPASCAKFTRPASPNW